MNIQHIVSPVDFSEASDHGLAHAVELARVLGARLTLLHVYQLPTFAAVGDQDNLIADRLRQDAQQQLDALVARLGDVGVPLEARLREGLPYWEIDELAKDEGADLIVMGTHGRTGLKHLWLGSVAERVVRTSPVPVLTVRLPD